MQCYRGIPLELTLQLTLQLKGGLQKLGIGDKNPEKSIPKFLSITPPSRHNRPGWSRARSQPVLGSGSFSPGLDGKLPGQAKVLSGLVVSKFGI